MALAPQLFATCSARVCGLLALGSCASIGAIGSVNQHLKLLFQDAVVVIQGGGYDVSHPDFQPGRRVVMGWPGIASARKVMIAACLFVACPLLLLFALHSPGATELFAVLFGFGLGADY
jgi:hypothetical protein